MYIMRLVEHKRLLVSLKDNKIKKIDNKNKGLEDEIKKLKLPLANLGVKNDDVNDKK